MWDFDDLLLFRGSFEVVGFNLFIFFSVTSFNRFFIEWTTFTILDSSSWFSCNHSAVTFGTRIADFQILGLFQFILHSYCPHEGKNLNDPLVIEKPFKLTLSSILVDQLLYQPSSEISYTNNFSLNMNFY